MRTPQTSAKAIFLQALELITATERETYLDAQCGSDADLRREVEELLRHNGDVGSFLESPPTAVAESAEQLRTIAPQTPSLGFLRPSSRADSLGRLAHYEILEVVGSGGMGTVLKAFDERLHRVVAIKVMAAPLATNAAARKRFQREARAAAAVCHDHIVTIHAVEESDEVPYLVMQCVSGLSLQQRIDRDGPLELHEILRIGMQTAAGLAAAHAQGLIHRDIKPANILLENGVERVKITDFGLARAAADASISQSGAVIGTPQYMAPEQARGEALDGRTDLFSLGSVLYAMCTGRAPFRATNSIAVLKRVCEEAPSPIREANADIPEWLVSLIDKLQAKNPDDRYQSAAEVAEVLGQRLAQLQNSTALLPMVTLRPPPARAAGRGWRRWAFAAAAVLVLAATFGLAEGTGATKFTATVIRLLTPEGTLVVEMTDPEVKVTIDGDGGLVITGVGQHVVHLKLGSHTLQAAKDGKPVPLDQELVTITRGDKPVVRVRLEGAAAPAVAASKAEPGAFVLLDGQGVEVRKFATLSEAVQSASDGDTIEVRGNGPFVSPPVTIGNQALTIRAGERFRPVIQLSPEGIQHKQCLLTATAPLVLEGIELHHPSAVGVGVLHTQAPLWAANCRFRNGVGINSPLCVFRNCESGYADGSFRPGARWTFENCLLRAKGIALLLHYYDASLLDVGIQIKRSTVVSSAPAINLCLDVPLPVPPDARQAAQPIRLDVSGSVFGGPNVLGFDLVPQKSLDKAAAPQPAEAKATLLRLLKWQGEHNIFAAGSTSVWANQLGQHLLPGPKGLEAWKRFWGGAEVDSLEGGLRFQGGNLLSRMDATPEQLTPEDFRLRADSLGYRAGKDGKDLGADVDLVGPGPAYERWKKTPEYQQWLKDTKQVAKSLDPDRKAAEYVLSIGRKANAHVAEGRLDEAADEFSKLLDLTADSNWNDPERKRIVEKIVTSDEVFPRVMKLRPKVILLWSDRGNHLVEQRRWSEAEACYRTRLELGPDGAGTWSCHAVTCLAANHHDAYRQVCEAMLKEFGEVADGHEAWWASWAMALAPHSVKDREKALRLAERTMKALPNVPYGARSYAAWLYRLDRLEESVACWDKAGKDDNEEIRICFLAMAHHRLGNSDLADQFVKQARAKKADWSKLTFWYNRACSEQLMSEMEKVVSGKPD